MHLKQYQWKNRLLLVFAPSPKDAQYQEQLELLSNDDELLERDLVMFHIFAMGSGFAGETRLSKEDVVQLQEKFKVETRAFTIVLIGKDGTEKQRWNEPVKSKSLFALVDDMPMRQQEMR
jgi:Domain of unknown function (DUF4174)